MATRHGMSRILTVFLSAASAEKWSEPDAVRQVDDGAKVKIRPSQHVLGIVFSEAPPGSKTVRLNWKE